MAYLSARADTAYDNAYHHKLRGRLWGALDGTEFDERHDADEPPGFVYSNPFPPRDMRAGDERKLLVAAPEEELLTHVARDLQSERELNIGEMPFRVEDVSAFAPDVGEPGTRGGHRTRDDDLRTKQVEVRLHGSGRRPPTTPEPRAGLWAR